MSLFSCYTGDYKLDLACYQGHSSFINSHLTNVWHHRVDQLIAMLIFSLTFKGALPPNLVDSTRNQSAVIGSACKV